jgi:hypothetical protein
LALAEPLGLRAQKAAVAAHHLLVHSVVRLVVVMDTIEMRLIVMEAAEALLVPELMET